MDVLDPDKEIIAIERTWWRCLAWAFVLGNAPLLALLLWPHDPSWRVTLALLAGWLFMAWCAVGWMQLITAAALKEWRYYHALKTGYRRTGDETGTL